MNNPQQPQRISVVDSLPRGSVFLLSFLDDTFPPRTT